jgi:hypothetical protein
VFELEGPISDPHLPDDIFMGNGGLLIIKLPLEI